MSETTYQIMAIILYFLIMIAIGFYSYRKTASLNDYMLGGRSLGPVTSALSAGASDMSQWLLMGLPGAIYIAGLAEGWMAIGLSIGAWVNWLIIAPRLRTYTEVSNNSITIPSYLDNRFKNNTKVLRIASGIVILLYFTFYVSSGMVAGGVFFQSAFDVNYHTGLITVAAVTIIYTLVGGFLAVSFTDVVQGTMMFLALILVPAFTIISLGGVSETVTIVQDVNPDILSFFAAASATGIISSLAWGLGYFGQPHIIVRFMAIKSVKETTFARRIGISWMVISLVGAAATAISGFAFFHANPDLTLADPEAVFIVLGQLLFHPFIAGLLLAAVLAAIMSTVSSQLLVTSSALVEDIFKAVFNADAKDKTYVHLGRIAVLAVSLVAMIFAWQQNDTILGLVSFAWAGFGASFGPIVLLSLFWRKTTGAGALWGMIVGAVVVFAWGYSPLSDYLYEIVPGFILSTAVIILVSRKTYKTNKEIEAEFDETMNRLKNYKDR
ncbi:sodium/proline symporter PutP [Oceanobacillus sp. CFH 90083]|uniref:sodium/proline symporter PutP n=1 Tax=Oceanobacillus sp. CFH 90083 TaxID=2592336 RepID=UPI00128C5252|nr:sodium/proline symporter PutP [Oceanobacillus sp. CFH 90083]